jgi:hypothetical protein
MLAVNVAGCLPSWIAGLSSFLTELENFDEWFTGAVG